MHQSVAVRRSLSSSGRSRPLPARPPPPSIAPIDGAGRPLLHSLIAPLPPNKAAFYTNEKSMTSQHEKTKFTLMLIMVQNVFLGALKKV